MLSKLKELSKDTIVYGISTIVGRFLGFILIPFYTQVFTTAEVGRLEIWFISFIDVWVLDFIQSDFLHVKSIYTGFC